MLNLAISVTFTTPREDTLETILNAIIEKGRLNDNDDALKSTSSSAFKYSSLSPSRDAICFGLIGPCASMGSWGLCDKTLARAAAGEVSSIEGPASPLFLSETVDASVVPPTPLLLPSTFGKTDISSTGEEGCFTVSTTVNVTVPRTSLVRKGDAKGDGSKTFLECRLVVWHSFYQCVVGFDNARTDPTLIPVTIPSSDSPGATTIDCCVNFNLSDPEAHASSPPPSKGANWQGDILLQKRQIEKQKLKENGEGDNQNKKTLEGGEEHIYSLPSSLPFPLPSCHITSCTDFRAINMASRGPYLRLIFYPHRNDLPFDADQWLQSIPEQQREVFREKRHTSRLRLTRATMVETTDFTNWSAFDGSSARARAGLFPPCIHHPSESSVSSTRRRPAGCAVPEPLREIEPVRDSTATGVNDGRTMVCWSVTYDLSQLTHHIPVIEFEGFNVGGEGGGAGHKGSFALLPDMFMLRDTTNGCSGVAAVSDDKLFVGPLYLTYALVRPFHHVNNSCKHVRSLESFEKLHYRTVMGHRGVGKTYTDSVTTQKLRVQKFSENSIPSFCSAHHRGAGAVEFDVMLTSDRVPVVCHEPVFTVETTSAGGRHTERTEVFVHQVTKRQLATMVKEALPAAADAQYRLKTMLEHHWRSILEIAKSKKGQQSTLNNQMIPVSSSEDTLLQASSNPNNNVLLSNNVDAQRHGALFGMTPTTKLRETRRLNLLEQTPFIANTPSHRDKHIPLMIPTLAEVMENTPTALGYNLEVKFPFQPKADRNLHLQVDNFEINRYCDLILEVIFKFAETQKEREIGFSSFDPDICTALMLKQNRYHVLFLADCADTFDQKDYRSWGLEAPIQYAFCERLAGVSIPARSLLKASDVETVLKNKVIMPRYKSFSREKQASLCEDPSLDSIDVGYGEGIVRVCNARGLHVWTWGGANDNIRWCNLQKQVAGVTGIITDNIPPPTTAGEM